MACRPRLLLWLATLAAGLAGCGPPPADPQVATLPRVAPPVAAPPDAFLAGAWGEFRSRRYHLRVPLPDGKGWQIDDHTSQWLWATHKASQSELFIRLWRDTERMNRTRCEERARKWRALPERAGADSVSAKRVNVPPEHDTTVEVFVRPEQPGKPLEAFVLAFGGWVRGCFAYVYTTRATGDTATRVLSERLATMVDGSLAKIVVESDLEPVIPREPSP